jgi:hypothetical protein
MNQRNKAAILIICALALGVGAFFLISRPSSDRQIVRQEVSPPANATPVAPSWVETGQTPEPDYSSSNAEAHNATPAEEPSAPAPKVIEIREDDTVTLTFVESLADFLLTRFIPADAHGKPATTASVKSLNIAFGQDLKGFKTSGNDIRKSRKGIFDYAFTPEMIKTLSALYTPVLMAQLTDTATADTRSYLVDGVTVERSLSKAETAAMLRLNARKMEEAANAFRAIATDPSITELAGKYLGAAKAVGRANVQLQNAIAENQDTTVPGQRLKQAILQRERDKAAIVSKMRAACPGCPDSDLFYLAQWSYRRVLNEPEKRLTSFAAAANALDDLAKQFRARSTELE